MSKVKITYFDVRGRGELARLVLEAAKKDYEQVTVDFAEWPKMKPGDFKMPNSERSPDWGSYNKTLSVKFSGLQNAQLMDHSKYSRSAILS